MPVRVHEGLYEFLKGVARSRKLAGYLEAAQAAGFQSPTKDDWPKVFTHLDEISRLEVEQHRPMLPVIVVGGKSQRPGPGFFAGAKRLGRLRDVTNKEFFDQELEKTYDFWSNATPAQLRSPTFVEPDEPTTGKLKFEKVSESDNCLWLNGKKVALPDRQFAFVLFLALASVEENVGFVNRVLLGREGFTRDGSRALVSAIRTRLRSARFPSLVETKRGIGYRLAVKPEAIEVDPSLEDESGSIGSLAGRMRLALVER
jgi:hypothetical protein